MQKFGSQQSLRERFNRDGFLHLKSFATRTQCAEMQQRMHELIASWDPRKTLAPVFSTAEDQSQAQGSSDYFLDSADRIHFFLEEAAVGEDGKLKPEVDKARAVNKVGHGMHVVDEVFKKWSFSKEVRHLVRELGWRNPVLPQSMYMFKQPRIGGEVTSHQDSCFLHTSPRTTCLALWLALDPARLENSCIWVRPGSHIEPVRRTWVRNDDYFINGNKGAQKMMFKYSPEAKGCKAMEWEGKLPEGSLYEKGFRPVECGVGDLIVFHGAIDHLSLGNTSDKTRDAYLLHLVEGPDEGITWDKGNWLQYPSGKEFPKLLSYARL